MKTTFFSVLFLVGAIATVTATPEGYNTVPKDLTVPVSIIGEWAPVNANMAEDYARCSASSTGVISSNSSSMVVTVTVHGRCDSSLARKLRAAIARVRKAFK
jgi:hypothetical protein